MFVNNADGNFSPKEILKVIWLVLIGQKRTSSASNVKEGIFCLIWDQIVQLDHFHVSKLQLQDNASSEKPFHHAR